MGETHLTEGDLEEKESRLGEKLSLSEPICSSLLPLILLGPPRHPMSQGSFPHPPDGEGKHRVSTTPELCRWARRGTWRFLLQLSQRATSAYLLFSLRGQQEDPDSHKYLEHLFPAMWATFCWRLLLLCEQTYSIHSGSQVPGAGPGSDFV